MENEILRNVCLFPQLFVFVIILVPAITAPSTRLKLSNEKETCLHLVSDCRKNSTCHSIYRRVKKNCASV